MKIEELINRYYETFTSNDQYICQCILNHREDCIKLSIDDFAYKYHVSSSTLSRFAQKLKLPGYSELRVILRLNQAQQPVEYQSMDEIMSCYEMAIRDIENKDCSLIFNKIDQAKRIIVFSDSYAQGRVAKEMKRMFLPTGKRIIDTYGEDMITSLKSFIGLDDIVFLISLNGENKGIVELAKEMKMRGIYTVSMTKMMSNTLAHWCDEFLYIKSIPLAISDTTHYEVITPYFILIELLYVKYKLYKRDLNILPINENMYE